MVQRRGSGETWIRDFAGRRFRSRLKRKGPGLLEERFGPIAFDLALQANGERVSMPVVGWRFLGLPMPRFLAPTSQSREYQDSKGRYCFDVLLALPIGGLLAHYRGWLMPGVGTESGAPAE